MKAKCECADQACCCDGTCESAPVVTLYRIDMEDHTGTLFCERCGDDALESGLFTEEQLMSDEELNREAGRI